MYYNEIISLMLMSSTTIVD